MIYPSIDKLLNIVDSKYQLVHVAAKRSRQMAETKHYQLKSYMSEKNIGRALEEVVAGLLHASSSK
jgi:DNA-directed RNA polymerase subunit omega